MEVVEVPEGVAVVGVDLGEAAFLELLLVLGGGGRSGEVTNLREFPAGGVTFGGLVVVTLVVTLSMVILVVAGGRGG